MNRVLLSVSRGVAMTPSYHEKSISRDRVVLRPAADLCRAVFHQFSPFKAEQYSNPPFCQLPVLPTVWDGSAIVMQSL